MQGLRVVISGLIALGVLVFVHELGHFLVAKLAGIRVLKFSLGFGSKLLGFKRGETEYLISALPLGGYVKMAGENPKETEAQAPQPGDYFFCAWWVRMLVLLAGPLMNLIAAAAVLGALYWVGFQVPIAQPQVVELAADSPAKAAGVQTGDIIVSLNQTPIENWEKFSDQLVKVCEASKGQPVSLGLLRQGRNVSSQVAPRLDPKSGRWQLAITIAPASSTLIDRAFVGTPAEVAGLKQGDRVLAVEGKPVWSKYDFQQEIWGRIAKPTRLSVQRGGQVLDFSVTPIAQSIPGQGRVGVIGVNFKVSDREERVSYPFFKAMSLGGLQTYGMSKMIIISLGQMVTGKISAKDSLGGPITIMRMAGQEAKSGLKDFFFFLAGISVMLGIVNLLPIPVLDGGSLAFFLIEGIFRKPLSIRVQEISQQIGFALLVALMVYATYNDLYKLVAPMLGAKP